MTKHILATFRSVQDADRAVGRLLEEGFSKEQVSMLVSDDTRRTRLAVKNNSKAPEGAAAGATIGGALGALVAGLTTVAGIVIPGVGLVVAGPLVAALAGAGALGAVGGVVGGLVGLGFNEAEAKMVEDAVKEGHVVVALSDEEASRIRTARAVFESAQAASVARA